jgi:hypothetical protein
MTCLKGFRGIQGKQGLVFCLQQSLHHPTLFPTAAKLEHAACQLSAPHTRLYAKITSTPFRLDILLMSKVGSDRDEILLFGDCTL